MRTTHTSILSLTLLTFLFAAETFATQVRQDWSFQVGRSTWQSVGLWGVEGASGEHPETWVFYGFGHFTVPLHIYAFTAIASVPLFISGFYACARHRRRQNAA
jgi:hypothetical protein